MREEPRYRTLAERSPFGIWQIDAEGRTIFANAVMRALLEVDDPEALLGVHYSELVDPRDMERIRDEHAKRPQGIASTYPIELVGRRGTRRSVVLSGAPIFDDSGRLESMIATLLDVTDRRRADETLERQTRIFNAVLNEMSDGVVAVDEHGRFLLFNAAGEQISGIGATDGPPEHWTATYGIFRADGVTPYPADQLPLARAMRGDSPEQEVMFVRNAQRPDGVYVSISGRPLRDERGSPKGAVVVFRDITEQRRLEEDTRRLSRMEAIGRLGAAVAHDFGTLIMAIRCYAQAAAQRTPAGDARRDDLDQILTACEHAAALSRQFIDFSRGTPVAAEPVDIAETVLSFEPLVRLLAGRAIEVEVKIAPSCGEASIERRHVEQVLVNLVANARDAMPHGGRLTIEVAPVVLDAAAARGWGLVLSGPYVRISVVDTGVGMGAEVQARVFEPYFSTKSSGEGRGLGLFVVYGILRQAGGHVTVRSAPGHGATFEVYLPQIEAGAAPHAAALAPALGAAVIVGSNEDQACEAARAAVGASGRATTFVSTAAAALEAAAGLANLEIIVVCPSIGHGEARELEDRIAVLRPNARVIRLAPTATADDVATLVKKR